MACHSSFCRAFSVGCGRKSYRNGPSRTLGSMRTVTSGVSTSVAIDRAPRESAARGVIFMEDLRVGPSAVLISLSVPCSLRQERSLGTLEPEPVKEELVEEPREHLVRGSPIVLQHPGDEGRCQVRSKPLQDTFLRDAPASRV